MGFDVIILAGAKNNHDLRDVSSKNYEALISIKGKPLIDYVMNIFNSLEIVNNIIIVGPDELKERFEDATYITSQASLSNNLERGLAVVKSEYCLISTADIPLINDLAVESFLEKAAKDQADFYYPIIPREVIFKEFSANKGRFIKLEEGDFTGGNIFLVRKEAVLDLGNLLDKILKWRKKQWKLAYLLGFKFIIKLLAGKLSLNLIEDEIYDLTGYKGKAVVLDYPGIGFDIDNQAEFKIIQKYMQ